MSAQRPLVTAARLLTLASCLAAPTVLTDTTQCFEESPHVQTPLWGLTTPSLTLELMDWDSSALSTRIAEILLREKLGYTVDVVKYMDAAEKGTRHAYGRVGTGAVDFNFELWRWEEDVYEAALAAGARELSNVGFKGQSGWFVPVDSLGNATYTQWSDDPAEQRETLLTFYRSLTLLDHSKRLGSMMRADDFSPHHLCAEGAANRVNVYGGVYDCAQGSWSVPGRCCARGATDCAAALPACIALFVEQPSFDAGQNERRVLDSNLPLEIVYAAPRADYTAAYGTAAAKAAAAARPQPLLHYWWEPSHIEKDSLVRVAMIPDGFCRATQTEILLARETACDFPSPEVHKMGHEHAQPLAADAWALAAAFTLNHTHVMQLLALKDEHGGDAAAAACAWLRRNEAVWGGWVDPYEDALPRILVSAALFSALIAYLMIWRGVRAACPISCASADTEPPPAEEATKEAAAGDEELAAQEHTKDREAGGSRFTWGVVRARLAREADAHVTLPILRVGDTSTRASVEVSLEDGTARQGVDFGEASVHAWDEGGAARASARAAGAASAATLSWRGEPLPAAPPPAARGWGLLRRRPPPLARSLTVVFEPKEASKAVRVQLFRAQGYNSTLYFSLKLRPPADAAPGGTAARIGPVAQARVQVINLDDFPRNGDKALLDELGSKTPEPSATAPATAPSARARRGGGAARVALIAHFLAEVHRGNYGKSAKYQLAQLYRATWATLGSAFVYNGFLDALTDGAQDRSLFIAFVAACFRPLRRPSSCCFFLLDYRATFVYHAGYGIARRFERMLSRKFLSLSEQDREALGEEGASIGFRYRTAILETSSNLAQKAYGTFHGALANVYRIALALGYLLWMSLHNQGNDNEGAVLIISVGFSALLLLFTLFYSSRAATTWRLWRDKFDAREAVYRELYFVTEHWRLIRLEGKEDAAALQLQRSIGAHLGAADREYVYGNDTLWAAKMTIQAVTYLLWAVAPLLTANPNTRVMSPNELLVMLSLIGTFGASLVGLWEQLIDLYTSGSMVIEVADMLNAQTSDTIRLKQLRKAEQRYDEVGRQPLPAAAAAAAAAPAGAAQAAQAAAPAAAPPEDGEVRALERARTGLRQRPRPAAADKAAGEPGAPADAESRSVEEAGADPSGLLQGVSYRSWRNVEAEGTVFEALQVFDHTTDPAEVVNWLPSGCLIGLRARGGGGGGALPRGAELILLKLLRGSLTPSVGLASFAPGLRTQLATQTPELIEDASLLANLLYGVLPAGAVERGRVAERFADRVPDARTLWRLCVRVGVSASVVGAEFREAWGALSMAGAPSWLLLEDQTKIALVRSLLHCPDMLLLHRVGDLWERQDALAPLLRAFLDGTLDHLTHAKGRALSRHKRTVLWCTLDQVLASALGEVDPVLTLESAGRASLRRKADALAGADAAANAPGGDASLVDAGGPLTA